MPWKVKKMEMKQEMINEAMDDVMEHDSDEEDELIQKVMDDVGLEWNEKLVDAPSKQKTEEKEDEAVDSDLQARLNNLKTG